MKRKHKEDLKDFVFEFDVQIKDMEVEMNYMKLLVKKLKEFGKNELKIAK